MSYKQAKIDLQKHFYDAWVAAGYSGDIITFPNEQFSKPSDSTWVRFIIFGAGGKRIELGAGGQEERSGFVSVEIFSPANMKGENDITTLIDTIIGFYKDLVTGGHHFDDHSLRGPYEAETGWMKADLSFPFVRYE